MMKTLSLLLLFMGVFAKVEAIWIGEEFWTIVNFDGSLYGGRTYEDFIRFKGVDVDRFVAYWITQGDGDNQFESYGEAYFRNSRVCARFVDKDDRPTEICGGFRVLSRGSHDNANPFEWYPIREVSRHHAVEYLSHQIAQVWQDNRLQSVFGGAHVDRGLGYAVDINNTVLHVSRSVDAHFYDNNIDLLTVKAGYHIKPYFFPEGVPYHPRSGHVFTPDDLKGFAYRRPSVPLDECHGIVDSYELQACRTCYNLRYDLNGNGIVDSSEFHACRNRYTGCLDSFYDINKDGIIDATELSECRTCYDLRFDTNGNGILDSSEWTACRNRNNGCPINIYDINHDNFLDAGELAECFKYLKLGYPYNLDLEARNPTSLNSDECHNPRYDLNSDGYISQEELRACRNGLSSRRTRLATPLDHHNCHNLIYDTNGDGIVDSHEFHACKHGRTDRFVRYCTDLYFDLNKDGKVDSFELERCLNQHDPIRRRLVRSHEAFSHEEVEEIKEEVREEVEQEIKEKVEEEIKEEVKEEIKEEMEEEAKQKHEENRHRMHKAAAATDEIQNDDASEES